MKPILAALSLLLASCASGGREPPRDSTGDLSDKLSAQRVFESIEARLLAATTVNLRTRIESEGAVASKLDGTLLIGADNLVNATWTGSFGGAPADMFLKSDGARLRGRGAERFSARTPRATNEALLVGCLRMGLLHNVAVLAGNKPPDHATGGVKRWVTVDNFKNGADGEIRGEAARSITFDVMVSGARAAEATLWVSRSTGLPLERTQLVHFESGDMMVVERYLTFEIGKPLPPGSFQIEG